MIYDKYIIINNTIEIKSIQYFISLNVNQKKKLILIIFKNILQLPKLYI